MRATFLINPNAGAGDGTRVLEHLQPQIEQLFVEARLRTTRSAADAAAQVEEAHRAGMDAIIAVGGDGTNQSLLNALMTLSEPRPALGVLPIGTGRDWARTVGIPLDPKAALRWLAMARPRRVDVGQLLIDGERRYFLNEATIGLSGRVAQRVNEASPKRPWTFMSAILIEMLRFTPPGVRIWTDDELFYEGDTFIFSVANGRYFGRGLMVNPHGRVDDGRFDVVLAEGMPKPAALGALLSLLRATHLQRDDVHHRQAQRVRIEPATPPIGLAADGEPTWASSIEIELLPSALAILAHDLE